MVGIAIEQGHISSIDDPISLYLTDSMNGVEPAAKKNITIKHLLTMSSGLESTSFGNYGRWVVSQNWVKFVLNGNLISEPGSHMRYSTGNPDARGRGGEQCYLSGYGRSYCPVFS